MPADYDPLLHVVLYQPEIPYNTGSVGRTCVAVGAKLWLVRPLGFRVDDYYLRRAGLDYWEHSPGRSSTIGTSLPPRLPADRPLVLHQEGRAVVSRCRLSSRATCWCSAASRPACPMHSCRPSRRATANSDADRRAQPQSVERCRRGRLRSTAAMGSATRTASSAIANSLQLQSAG